MKVYGYCRISTSKQSMERQIRNIKLAYPDAVIVKETYTGTKIQGRKEFEKLLTEKLFNEFAIDLSSATDEQIYRALALIVRGMLSAQRKRFMSRTYGANGKQVYYLCMEFLMGRSLTTSLLNLGLCGVADEVLRDYSMTLDNIYEQEPDAGLGNGGLGRLAACYLDGMATDDIPGTGYSILYEYGIFKQKIVDGWPI